MRKRLLENINFIFYVPGSAGSLLSVLMKSQIEEDFVFNGFVDDTAHNYDHDAVQDTQSHRDYIEFKKSNISITDHIEKNLCSDSLTQRIFFPKWIDEFIKIKNLNLIICYMEDYNVKLFNFYKKTDGSSLAPPIDGNFDYFKIDKTHEKYETIMYIKCLNWLMELEKKHLHTIPTIKIDKILKKDFNEFQQICKITNVSLLEEIIDQYNVKNKKDFNILPNSMKRYLKKYHNSV